MPQAALVTQITGAPMRTVRPLMLREVYANPEKELARLHRQGRVTKIAAGTYVAKPDDVEATTPWKPNFEEAAMAYATAAYGPRVPILYGLGAARFHHAIPRALGVTVIAVPQQHHAVNLTDGGRVVFTTTDTDQIDARLETGKLGKFLVATPEQTLLDLIARPTLGGLPREAAAAVRALAGTVDRDRLERLAADRPRTVQARLRTALA